jgi:hypothetical protein
LVNNPGFPRLLVALGGQAGVREVCTLIGKGGKWLMIAVGIIEAAIDIACAAACCDDTSFRLKSRGNK